MATGVTVVFHVMSMAMAVVLCVLTVGVVVTDILTAMAMLSIIVAITVVAIVATSGQRKGAD